MSYFPSIQAIIVGLGLPAVFAIFVADVAADVAGPCVDGLQ